MTTENLKGQIPLVEIPAGEIQMNDDRTKKQWTVHLNPFFLAKYPVTQALYTEVIGENPSYFQGGQHPVETVTWADAAKFCNRLSTLAELNPCYQIEGSSDQISFDQTRNGYRLPLEAEWQYACQAGTKAIRYGELSEIAWFKENSQDQTHPVGQKQPNEWGLYDMLGNVWEWCSDIYDATVYGTYRVFRGGGLSDEARSVMATTRRRSHPTKFKIEDLGFRIAKNFE